MFDKQLWKPAFTYWPSWPCPACRSVALGLRKGKEKKLLDEETGPSKRARSHDDWEPDWIERKFAAILECHNPACGELVSVAGRVALEEEYSYDENGDVSRSHEPCYMPVFFDNAPPIFAIPRECPDAVKTQLLAAFAAIWFDLAAAANRLRAGVEALLDDHGIPKTSLVDGKRKPLTTHSRIEKFKKANADGAEYLMAIKWLGNAGSHGVPADINRNDLLDATALFEATIELVYLKSAEKFAKIAAALNKRKGKPKKHKKKALP